MPSLLPSAESAEKVLKHFNVTVRGLLDPDVQSRLQRYGRNRQEEAVLASGVRTFFRQFESSLVIILLVAAATSFAIGDHLDGIVILVAVALNVGIGYVQERRAERALAALQRIVTHQASVLRDGREREVPATLVVPGDVLLLRAGQRVPADARIIEAFELETNEATLTGEAEPVAKKSDALPDAITIAEQVNMVFAGTVITQGSGLAVVTATGKQSEFGKIAGMLQTTVTEHTPLQRRLNRFSWQLTRITLTVTLLLFLFGLFRLYEVQQIFTTSVAIAVAIIPEGLVIAVTVILALGMRHMLQKRALARTLLAAEALGSVTVIATDKTGTLTEGYMRVVRILTHDRQVSHPHRDPGEPDPTALFVLKAGALASEASIENPDKPLEEWDIRGNLTERAIVRAAAESGFLLPVLHQQYVRVGEVPFESSRRFMAILYQYAGHGYEVFVKGAPETIFPHVHAVMTDGREVLFTPEIRSRMERDAERMSSQGLRTLAIATRRFSHEPHHPLTETEATDALCLIGIVGIQDPLRPDAVETIAQLGRAGIRTVMLTGDNLATASAIALGLGLPVGDGHVMDGRELERLDAYALHERVRTISVFARVSPRNKLRIVQVLQASGEVVAMTGDGVNDAPALKAADIGVALGSGTDVAKEAADLVLLDNNLRTIAAAVFEGRVIYRNIKRVILYLMAGSFAELVIIAVALVFGWPLPLTAAQILYLNIVNDTLPTFTLTREPVDAAVLNEPPVPLKRPLFGTFTRFLTITLSLVVGGIGLAFFALGWRNGEALTYARSLTFAFVATSSIAYMFSTRTLRQPLTSVSPFSNPSLLLTLVVALGMQVAAIYTPLGQRIFGLMALSGSDWLLVVLGSLVTVGFIELSKYVFRRRAIASI